MTVIFVTFYGNGYGIIIQWRRDLGTPEWRPGLRRPEKNITRYKSNYLHHVRTQFAIWCIHASMRPPSKISIAVKTTCERIAPSKSFLGANYNHGRLYSDICKKLISLKHCVRSQITRLKLQKSFCDLEHGASL